MTENPNWTPVLSADGEFYCSPRCGGGKYCRKEWFDRATSRAAALAERMGEGWEPHVWENLGWHYKARLPFGLDREACAEVREEVPVFGEPSYRAEIRPGVAAGAVGLQTQGIKATLQFFGRGDDPHEALGEARGFLDAEARILAEAFTTAQTFLRKAS